MVRRRKPPELILVLDYGGSATKGVYADSALQENLLCMEPEVISLPYSAIASYEKTQMGDSREE